MKRALACVLVLGLLAGGCTRYEQKPLSFRLPSSYPNATQAFGATIAARPFDDSASARELFGFDILAAGVMPVQVVFDNQGTDSLEIVAGQTFLVDKDQNVWNILDQKLAYSRIEKSSEWGKIAPEAGKGAFLGAAAGAVVGAAIGIVSGRSVGEALGKGAAVGAAGGALLGGAKGYTDHESTQRTISDDLRNRSLENRPIPPKALSHGILFFPAEAVQARTLRLQLKNPGTGELRTLELAF